MIIYKVTVDIQGTKKWYLNDELHREDGPAEEWADGTKAWYLNGELHREDGPSVEYANGKKRWHLNGIELTKKRFNNRHKARELTMAELETLLGHKVKIIK